VKIHAGINYGILVIQDFIAIHGIKQRSKLNTYSFNKSSLPCRTSTWECVCRTLDEWNIFIENFRKSCSKKNSSHKDRQLLERLIALNTDLPDIYSRKDRERLRRWTSYEPKRASNRLEVKRQQRLELEEITQEQKARHDKFLEFKRRQEETIAKEKERLERSERVKRREGLFFILICTFKKRFVDFFLKNVQIVFVAVQQQQV
jgi:hypothetical protein